MSEFTCDMCRGTFKKGWTEEEAEAEYRGLFNELPKEQKDDRAEICEDCYQLFMSRYKVEMVE